MNHNKTIWMAIKSIALDNGFYTKYLWKGGASKPKFEGMQVQVRSPRQDALWIELECKNLELLDCHNLGDLAEPK